MVENDPKEDDFQPAPVPKTGEIFILKIIQFVNLGLLSHLFPF